MIHELARTRRARRLVPAVACAAVTLAVISAVPTANAATAAGLPVTSAATGARTIEDFDHGWKFALVNSADTTDPTGAYADAMDPGFDDSSWRSVDVPHDWSNELAFTNAPGAGTDSGTGWLPGGLGWYRKTFTLPPAEAGKRISLEFDGVYEDSYVYLNGQLVGNHPYGYTGFAVDLTPLVHTDGVTENVVAVKVQNKLPGSRWYPGSGIERNVRLIVTDPIHVVRHGTFETTPDLASTYTTGDYATVNVKTTVANDGGSSLPVGVVNRVLDSSGAVVASGESSVTVGADPQTDSGDLRVEHPHLWSPDSPYLYTLQTDLVVRGKTVDNVSTTFGIRWESADPDQGFFLNGKHIKLQGVDLHHDEGSLGAADNYDAYLRQLKLFKAMGVNFLRTSHNPPAPEVLDICDRLGIMVMEEAFDVWNLGKTPNDYSRFFNANGDSDISEMVNAAKNHPAIMLWSIGNEIGGATTAAGVTIGRRLVSDIRAIDTTRPVTIGTNAFILNQAVPGQPSGDSVDLLDGVGMHYSNSRALDTMHQRFPTKFFFESEVGAVNSTRGSYFDPDAILTGDDNTPGQVASSGYGNTLPNFGTPAETSLKQERDRPYLLGMTYWAGSDYQGEHYMNPGADFPWHINNWGLVDTAGFPKDPYYLFQSQWASAPMVHLVPTNWTDYKPGQNVQVWAYSNADTVELFLNGRSLGVRRFDHKTTADGRDYLETTECTNDDRFTTTGNCPGSYTSPNGSSGKLHLTWNVPFEPGKLVAVASKDGHAVARDEVDTAGPADTLTLTPEIKVIKADGRALSYVDVKVVDKNGVMVPSAGNRIAFNVTGAGTLAAVDNGNIENIESYHGTSRSAYHGMALAILRSDGSNGPIQITARSPGLLPATATVYASDATSGDVGVDPVVTRAALGESPSLPSTVRVVAADGSSRELPVRWNPLPADAARITGTYEVHGTTGTSVQATADVSVYAVGSVATYSTLTPTAAAPVLPATARVLYTDGVERSLPVDWAGVSPSQYAIPGTFTVKGTVAGVAAEAIANVRVSDDVMHDQNLARSTSPAHPTGGASFSGSASTVPAAMLDGNTTTGGWSNFFDKVRPTMPEAGTLSHLLRSSRAHASDWVSVSWPQPQHFGRVLAYFTTSTTRALPASVAVSYWDGRSWVAVRNPAISWATGSNQPSTITFDPVATTKLKLEMTSQFPAATNGHLQISELQVIGDLVIASSNASLDDLQVNGQTVPGFDPATTDYAVTSDIYPPVITATAADNGSVAIQPPPSIPGNATVTVTSEDGLQTKIYSVYIRGRQG